MAVLCRARDQDAHRDGRARWVDTVVRVFIASFVIGAMVIREKNVARRMREAGRVARKKK